MVGRREWAVNCRGRRGRRMLEAMTSRKAAPAPLSDPLMSLGYLTRILFRSFVRALEVRTAPHGVTTAQWRFLRVLWQEDGLTQRELSRRVGMREPTTVIALRGLEAAGLITREAGIEDRRRMHVSLTRKARGLRKVLAPSVDEVNQIATRGMTQEEIDTLRRLLALAGRNLAEEASGETTTEA